MCRRSWRRRLGFQSLESRCVLSSLHGDALGARDGDTAGNRWSAARDIDPASELEAQEFVGRGDPSDWYRLQTDHDVQVDAQVTELEANVDLLLLKRTSGRLKLVERSRNPGASSELIDADLPPGEFYFVVLSRSSQGTAYRLSMSLNEADPPPPTDPPTSPPTDPPTSPPTDPPTSPPTDPPTSPPTDPPTSPPTDPPTDPPVSDPPSDPPPVLDERPDPVFSSRHGFGLVDISAAVAQVLGDTPPSDVAPLAGAEDWNLNLVNAPGAWSQGATGEGVIVAVIDTGVDYTHDDLNENIWRNQGEIAGDRIDNDRNGFVDDVIGWDFAHRDNNPMDVHGHGTHVAGIIAAENNDFGPTGVAYDAQIMPIQVLGEQGSGSSAAVASGIRYAVNMGADVINLSLSLRSGVNRSIQSAVQYAHAKGVVVVMAAGNQGASRPAFPARMAASFGLAVGAIDANRTLAEFSNIAGAAPLQYVVAPGREVLSTHPNDRYARWSGTSMAAPHVAGAAALLLSANAQMSPAAVIQVIASTAQPLG